MNLSPREKRLVVVLVLLLAALGFYRFIWQSALPKYRQVRQAVAAEAAALSQAQAQTAGLENLRRQVEAARQELAGLRRKFGGPTTEVLRQILTGLPAAVKLEEVVPDQPAKRDFYTVLPVRLKVSGPYPDVEAFLGRLESWPAYLRELRLAQSENGTAVTADISLELFSLEAPGTSPPVAPAGGARNPFLPLPSASAGASGGEGAKLGEGAPQPDGGAAQKPQPAAKPSQEKTPAATAGQTKPQADSRAFPNSQPAGKETQYNYSFPAAN